MNLLPLRREGTATSWGAWAKRAVIALPLLCLLIFGTVSLASKASGASAASLMPIKGHVPALVKTSALVGPTDTNQSLTLSIGLQLRNANSLKSYVDNMSRANSITKKHLTSAQVATAFAPLASSQQAVIDYMQSNGFQVTSTGKLHLQISFKGNVGDAENAFHLQINNYRSPKGQNFFAPASDPSVPANLADLIQNVAGLNNLVHFSHPPISSPKNVVAHSATANGVSCPGVYYGFPGYYLPSQIATAYNLNSFYNAGFHGEGQTMALFELDGFNMSDINAYTSCYGQSHAPINTVAVNENPAPPGANAAEVELDAELILSAAPNLASLDIYEAPNDEADFMALWSRIISDDSASVISVSWGRCEADAPTADLQAENNLFMTAAAQGQTIFAASGDTGTNDCLSTDPNANSLAVDDPSSQPYVTGVGGTRLTLQGNNTIGSEHVWNEWYNTVQGNLGATGGGISGQWGMPSWQQGPGVLNGNYNATPCGSSAVSGHCREVPDVSLNADPMTGYPIYCTVAASQGCVNTGWTVFGGTSTAAPMWAAFMALTNEKALHDGGFNIGFINPYLYQIDQNAGGTSYSADFNYITSGAQNDNGNDDLGNDTLQGGAGPYQVLTNYSMATGLGSYNGWNLAGDLEKLANAQNGSLKPSTATTWYFAEGSVGNDFQEYLTILNPSATTAANVSITYLFENQAAVTVAHTVAASSRFTVNVNNDLNIPPTISAPQYAISAIVSSTNGVGIVAERPMYFNLGFASGGTDVVGATNTTNKTFYFAQGDTSQAYADNSKEYITILNPSSTTAANVTATFYSNGQVVDTEPISVAPLHRGTIIPKYLGQAAIKVVSDQGVVVERPLYFNNLIPNMSDPPNTSDWVNGASSTVGATSLGGVNGSDWLFAEGHTADHFQEYIVLANFTTSTTTATIKLEYTNGSVQTVNVTVNALSQVYFDVNNAYINPVSNCGCTPTADVSAEVTAPTASIVAERVMYFHYQGPGMTGNYYYGGGTDVVGEAGTSAHNIYSFAEGYTISGYPTNFQEWLTLQNPNASSEVVAITLFFDGTIVQKEVTLPAHSRTTFYINDIVDPVATAYPSSTGYEVSIDVQAFGGGTVVAERPMYFNYNTLIGGTDVIGYTSN